MSDSPQSPSPAVRLDPKKFAMTARIPEIPEALKKIFDAANDPTISSVALEKLVLKDAGLCVQILKMVNSSFYGVVQRVSSVRQAIVLLGHGTIKSIAASLIMLETVGKLKGLNPKYLKKVWSRSVISSGMIRILTRDEDYEAQQRLFQTALVQDLGRLILSWHFKEAYVELVEKNEYPDPTEEREKLGIHHAELGAELLGYWGFPPAIVELVRGQHSVSAGPKIQKEINFLKIANILANMVRAGKSFKEPAVALMIPQLKPVLETVGWTWEKLEAEEAIFFAPELADFLKEFI